LNSIFGASPLHERKTVGYFERLPMLGADRHPLFGRTTTAIGVMLIVLALPYASPRLRMLRVTPAPWDRAAPVSRFTASTEPGKPAPTVGEQTLGPTTNEATVSNALPDKVEKSAGTGQASAKSEASPGIEDPTGHALDTFYASLAKTIAKEDGAVTRILHYGDSMITGDLISGTMRREMQAKFGDAGHGFILIANPWEWYFHNDVSHHASDGWTANRITGPLSGDGIYGLGGVSFHTAGEASAWFSTKSKGDFGLRVSRFDIYYLEQPWGGDVQILVPGRPPEMLRTRGPKKVSRVHSVSVPDGPGQMTLHTWGDGDVRMFGVALERDVPGVTYDALGANGARIRLWDAMSTTHWADQFALRKPALVVLQYGTNESEDNDFKAETYEAALDRTLSKVQEATPDTSILIVGPLDRAEKGEGGKLRTKPIIVRLVDMQRNAARAHRIAFWNAFEAMGGEGAMGRWVKASPQLGGWDFTHPTPLGAETIAGLLFAALNSGYAAYAASHRAAGASPLE
jgi:lysophospholipase L1-like esterase